MHRHSDPGRVALMYGPLVLAADIAHNTQPIPASFLYLATATDDTTKISMSRVATGGAPVFVTDGLALEPGRPQPHPVTLRLRPYYAVGSSFFTVWLKRPASLTAFTTSFFSFSSETRSRGKHFDGTLCDTNTATVSVAEDGTVQREDWFALTLPKAVTITHAAFAHGYNGWHGGWFDSSGGKPRLQVRKTVDGPWEEIAAFSDYPQTTASSFEKLREEQRFYLTFPPVTVVAIRVIGKPSWGDQPGQNQSSCGELEAY